MKNRNKTIVSMIIILAIVLQTFSSSNIVYCDVNIRAIVPKEATEYAFEHYDEILEVVKKYNMSYNISEEQIKKARIGMPFVIYELDEWEQDEIYYYPVIDSENSVILLISIIGTTEGWQISASTEWVDELNQIDYTSTEFIFYKSKGNFYAENKVKNFCIKGEDDLNIKSFKKKSYYEKKQIINSSKDKFVKSDINNIEINGDNVRDSYTPTFSSSTSSSKTCALYNAKGQGNYGLCWAASIATICNYIRGTNYSAMQVADTMGMEYDEGATLYEAKQTLLRHGIMYQNMYTYSYEPMSWDTLRRNVDAKYPVYVSAKSSEYGHAVVAYGYLVAAGVRYITLWNPGINSANGDSITVAFRDSGTTFTYDNETYTWKYSVAMY